MSDDPIDKAITPIRFQEIKDLIEDIDIYHLSDVIKDILKSDVEKLPPAERCIFIAQLFTLLKPKSKVLNNYTEIEEEPWVWLINDSDRSLGEFVDEIIKKHELDISGLAEAEKGDIDSRVDSMILSCRKKVNEIDAEYISRYRPLRAVGSKRDFSSGEEPSRQTGMESARTDEQYKRAKDLLKRSLAKEFLRIMFPNINFDNLPPQDKFDDLIVLNPSEIISKVLIIPGYSRIPREYQPMFFDQN